MKKTESTDIHTMFPLSLLAVVPKHKTNSGKDGYASINCPLKLAGHKAAR
jgi:hypothetical protein